MAAIRYPRRDDFYTNEDYQDALDEYYSDQEVLFEMAEDNYKEEQLALSRGED